MRKKVFIALRMAGIAGQEKLSGIFRFLGDNHDWDIRLVRTAGEFSVAAVKDALRSKYDGFIVSIPGTEETAAVLATTDIPTIVMDIHSRRLAARKRNIVFIRNSSEEIGRTAANHLLAIGTCRSYAFVHNPSVMQWSIDRCRAFRETLRDNGFWCHEFKTPDGLQKLQRPVGVFAANDDRGYDVIEFCHAHRMRVPEDAAVLEGIGVSDVVTHLKVSRRLADLRFRELQHTSIGGEITRIRLAEVQRLLRATREPIDSIAAKCGYTNPNYLKNLFRKRFSMSMREFRKMS